MALGIGAAVASSPGIAWADPDTSSSPSTDSATASPADAGQSVTPTRTDAETDTEKESLSDNEDGGEPTDDVLTESEDDNETPPTDDDAPASSDRDTVLSSLTRTAEDKSGDAEDDEPVAVDLSQLDDAEAEAQAVPTDALDVEPVVDATTVTPLAAPVAVISDVAAATPTTESTTVTGLLATVLAPLVPPNPDAPTDSPLVLALWAAARRPSESAASQKSAAAGTSALTAAVPNSQPSITSTRVSSPGWFTAKVTGQVRATDPDRDKLTFTAAPVGSGNVTVNSRGSFTYTPSAAARHAAAATSGEDRDTVAITVSDGYGGSITTYLNVTIRPANSAPRAKAIVGKGNPSNGVVTGKISATDRDGDALTFTGPGATPRGNVVVKADGSFVYTPTAAARDAASSPFKRSDRFTVTVNDGHGGTDTVTVRVRIVTPEGNRAPKAGSPAYTITGVADANGQVTGRVNVTDPDGFALTYGLAAGVDSSVGTVTVDATTGAFSFTPTTQARENAHGTPGEDTVRFTVAASDGLASATVQIAAPISAKAPTPPPPPPPSDPTFAQRVASFVSNNYGKTVANAQGTYAGECVSLVSQFLRQVHNITTAAWGNAVDYRAGGTGGAQLAARGFTWHTDKNFQNGDILVWGGGTYTTSYGHIGIWHNGKTFDQNSGWHRDVGERQSGYSQFFSQGYLGYWRKSGTSGGGGGGGATSGTKSGTGTVVTLVNVRNDPSTNGPVIAQYSPGQTFNYDSWVIGNGYYWLSYVSYSGTRRYVAEATLDHSIVYVRGGAFH
ncbi:Ig-like domain-containing protein [Mycolicibacterium sp. D5.8-2]|uniref:Ig-like domain-containing protein n=1 Tax=Mycolicibacterium sp. D5.8-2 TaxID=3085903 RepID=UPI00298BD25A|nr:Ig-like domain-containing protein [Mycolicibacterium sp. D5.8-2]MDW5612029.1 Ig-like domain-containing protein [Mycolicibacterium sp. D5.8-2]